MRNDARKEVSYQDQYNAIKPALEYAGLFGTKKTHMGRSSGARMAEAGGASQGDIARHGKWATSVMENVYLSEIPRTSLRVLAGFTPAGGSFYIPRDIDVPAPLAALVFPQLQYWETYFKQRENIERDTQGPNFIKVLL